MRVCWAVYGELDQPTGGYVYDRLVVEGLRARGDAVEVVDLRGRPILPALREDAFDVVVGDALCVEELGPAFEAAPRETGRVLLVHHLGSWEVERADRGGLRAVEARAIAAADRLVVTGRATGARLSDELRGRPVDVVPPGADRLPRHPRGERGERGNGRVDLLFVGSLIPRKRLPMLLDAVERVGDRELSLTLAGDAGRDPAHAREIAERIRGSPALHAAVRVAGVLGDDGLARAMAGADALVLPSSLEGYGMVLTEAIHAGLPVIASRPAAVAAGLAASGAGATGATGATGAADAAMVFDDLESLVAALRAFVDDPVLRATMRRAARDTPVPTWSEAVDAFRAVLTRAVAEGPGRDRAPSRR